jgi:hypothetical protein
LYCCEEKSEHFKKTNDHYKLLLEITPVVVRGEGVKKYVKFCGFTKQNILDY